MLFSSIAAACLLPLTIASPLVKRQSADNSAAVLQDIQTVVNDITTLNNTLNTFRPDELLGFATALVIQEQTQQLGDDLQATTAAADASSNFTADESGNIATAVINLEPMIQSLLTNIVAHKPAFATAVFFVGDLSKTVEGDLENERTFSQDFGTALTAKLAEPYSDFAPLVTAQILDYFDAAIAKYQTCSGILCLPDISGLKQR